MAGQDAMNSLNTAARFVSKEEQHEETIVGQRRGPGTPRPPDWPSLGRSMLSAASLRSSNLDGRANRFGSGNEY